MRGCIKPLALLAAAVFATVPMSGCYHEGPYRIGLQNLSGDEAKYLVSLVSRDAGEELFSQQVTLANGSRATLDPELRSWPGMDLLIAKEGSYNATQYVQRKEACPECYVNARDDGEKIRIWLIAYETS